MEPPHKRIPEEEEEGGLGEEVTGRDGEEKEVERRKRTLVRILIIREGSLKLDARSMIEI